MSLYPADSNDADGLYPNDGGDVRNPMRTDLNANHFKIINLNELDLSGAGAITGVNTINGLPYPPTLPQMKNNVWLYASSTAQNIYSGYGAQQNSVSWETVVYNSPLTPVSLQSYTWPSGTVANTAFITPYAGVYKITTTIFGIPNQNCYFSMDIYVGGGRTSGGNIVFYNPNGTTTSIIMPIATTTVNLAAGTIILVAGGDADATGYSVAVGGRLAGGNVECKSIFMVEYLG
jgi:hypothetical protein